ncbi:MULTISPECIES: hypothetical protein [Mycolicibacterium]|uniref:hypothetical protein n=1 Tax=Mycolicibacterium TaxID=1866885 RepID=UPI0011D99725|nr:hypothetical protein [Mycolicibacterium mageritense]MBN3458006.1 hypothetical protein [Mycobacterium sp. DSM 3803]TXI63615.1 MAG: hypothetical protein E6Q55_09105 [Mycolicibacterium mageritense]
MPPSWAMNWNSGSGHAVFASVPETLSVVAGAGSRDEETRMLRFGFQIIGAVLVIMIAGATITTAFG